MMESLAAVFHGPGQPLELRRIPLPTLQQGETLVRVLGCTICGSDVHSYRGRRSTPTPTILGHEIVGEVQSMGPGERPADVLGTPLEAGDRVTWAVAANCGQCFFCQRDLPQKCVERVKYGHERVAPGRELLGGAAEHCWLPSTASIVRLPDTLPLSAACPASCATATVAAAWAACSDAHRGGAVCVLGLGMLGLTACAFAKTFGAENVVGVDPREDRRALAQQFGATRVFTPGQVSQQAANEGLGFDLVLELSGATAAVEASLELVRIGGTIAFVGSVFPSTPLSVDPERIVRRNLTLRGVHNYRPQDLADAVNFLELNHERFPFARLVDRWLPLEQAEEAFQSSGESLRLGISSRRDAEALRE